MPVIFHKSCKFLCVEVMINQYRYMTNFAEFVFFTVSANFHISVELVETWRDEQVSAILKVSWLAARLLFKLVSFLISCLRMVWAWLVRDLLDMLLLGAITGCS